MMCTYTVYNMNIISYNIYISHVILAVYTHLDTCTNFTTYNHYFTMPSIEASPQVLQGGSKTSPGACGFGHCFMPVKCVQSHLAESIMLGVWSIAIVSHLQQNCGHLKVWVRPVRLEYIYVYTMRTMYVQRLHISCCKTHILSLVQTTMSLCRPMREAIGRGQWKTQSLLPENKTWERFLFRRFRLAVRCIFQFVFLLYTHYPWSNSRMFETNTLWHQLIWQIDRINCSSSPGV